MQAAIPRVAIVLAAIAATGCGASDAQRSRAARAGVAELAEVLRGDDARAAYELLAKDVRATVSFEAFEATWRETKIERTARAAELDKTMRGAGSLGERATLRYPDGKTVNVVRDADAWHMESPIVARGHASRPRDAVKILFDALATRSFDSLMGILTERRQSDFRGELELFIATMGERLDAPLDLVGPDRAELRWDSKDRRYRVVLRKERDEWRVDDIHVAPIPQEERSEPVTPLIELND